MAGFRLADQRRQAATWVLAAVVGAIVLIAAFVNGRERSRQAAADETAAVQAENKSFCAGLGFRSESELFARCVEGLTDIRRRARDRIEEQTEGLI